MDEAGFTFYLAFHLKNNLVPVGLWLPHPKDYNISTNTSVTGVNLLHVMTPKLLTPVVLFYKYIIFFQ